MSGLTNNTYVNNNNSIFGLLYQADTHKSQAEFNASQDLFVQSQIQNLVVTKQTSLFSRNCKTLAAMVAVAVCAIVLKKLLDL